MTRALWFVGPRQVELRPIALPPLSPGRLRVRTLCSGVSSGTELLAYRGQLPADLPVDESLPGLEGSFAYPFQYGYSAVGEIEHGVDGAGFAAGELVFAFRPHQERFDAAPDELVSVNGLTPRRAVMLPYVETALQVALDAGPVLGETVVVCGLGVLGVLVGRLLQDAGAQVLASEPQRWRRDVAAAAGITTVAPDDLTDAARDAGGVPLAIECSGHPAALAPLLDVVAHEGTVLVASWYGTNEVSLPLGGSFHRRRLTIRSTQVSTIPAALSGRWSHRRRLLHAARLAGALPLDDLATDTVPFDDAAAGYARLDSGAEGVMHVAFGYS